MTAQGAETRCASAVTPPRDYRRSDRSLCARGLRRGECRGHRASGGRGPSRSVVNFGISGIERILRELRAAFHRRGRETVLAQQNARILLWNSLKDDVTALLLCCGVILDDPALDRGVAVRVKTIEAVANRIKEKLAAEETMSAGSAGA